jgi:hypothetical protein
VIATGGATLGASAYRGGGGHGDAMGHYGGGVHGGGAYHGFQKGNYPKHVGILNKKLPPLNKSVQLSKNLPPPSGHWQTRYWSRWGSYPRYSGYHGGGSCWRWVTTDYGPKRVWVCREGYGRSYGSYGYGSYRYGGSYSKWVPGHKPGPHPGPHPGPKK